MDQTYGSVIQTLAQSGYQPQEILDWLRSDPVNGARISQVEKMGYDPNTIVSQEAKTNTLPFQAPQSNQANSTNQGIQIGAQTGAQTGAQATPQSNTQAQPSQSDPMSVGGFLKNTATGFFPAIGNTLVGAAKGLYGLGTGVAEKGYDLATGQSHPDLYGEQMINGIPGAIQQGGQAIQDAVNNPSQALTNIGHSVYNDPSQALFNVAGAASGVGGLVGKIGKIAELVDTANAARAAGLTGEAAATANLAAPSALSQGLQNVGTTLSNVGTAVNPMTIAGKVGGALGGNAILNTIANIGYANAIKTPVADLLKGKSELAPEFLQRGIAGTVGQMKSQVQNLMDQARVQIQGYQKAYAGTPIDLTNTIQTLLDLRDKLVNTPGESTAPIDSFLQDMHNQLKASAGNGTPTQVPLEVAQKLKQNLQDSVNYNKNNALRTGTDQAQELAARTLRNDIATAIPQLAQPNEDYYFAKRASDALTKTDAGNGLIDTIKILGGLHLAATGGIPGMAAAGTGLLMNVPATGTRIAQGANKLAGLNQTGTNPFIPALLNALGNQGNQSGGQ